MRPDYDKIKSDFQSINLILLDLAARIEKNLSEVLNGIDHIDRIGCRIKTENSFLDKTLKKQSGKWKYQTPLKEIQDLIGARIVVYYKTDVESVVERVKKFYQTVETNMIVPDDVTKFGYEVN
jgi:ppGpp synthetase/RelA/SpoT-type nucleotidyltranferase